MKSCTFSGRALNVNNPAVVIANALDDSQTDTQAFTLRRTPKEAFIQEGQVKRLYTYTGIGDRETAMAEIHADKTALGILHGIAKQVHKRRMQRLTVQGQDGFRLNRNLEIEALAINLRTYGLHCVVDAFSQSDRLHDT